MNKNYWSIPSVLAFVLMASCSSLKEMGSAKKKEDLNDTARELQDEINIGREVAAKLLGTYGDLNERKKSVEYLNLIVQSLAEKTGRPEIIYRVGILDTDQVNAFAAPGGYILITRGLLNFVQNEQELAGVLAHEMGHINHKHLFKEIVPKREVSTGETLSRFLSKGSANMTFAFSQAVNQGIKTLLDEGLKPELEFEADQCGLEYTWAAGYDPHHFRVFMARLAKSEKLDTKNLLKTHPSFNDRLNKMDSHLAELGVSEAPPVEILPVLSERFMVLSKKK